MQRFWCQRLLLPPDLAGGAAEAPRAADEAPRAALAVDGHGMETENKIMVLLDMKLCSTEHNMYYVFSKG